MVYLLDPNSGTGMSVDHQYMAQAIADRYPDYRLAQVPLSDRDAREEFPFAIVDLFGNVIKPLREREVTVRFIFQWLYENDIARHGEKKLYEKMLSENEKVKAAAKAAERDKLHEGLEFVHSLASSNKHYYKHAGKKYGY